MSGLNVEMTIWMAASEAQFEHTFDNNQSGEQISYVCNVFVFMGIMYKIVLQTAFPGSSRDCRDSDRLCLWITV